MNVDKALIEIDKQINLLKEGIVNTENLIYLLGNIQCLLGIKLHSPKNLDFTTIEDLLEKYPDCGLKTRVKHTLGPLGTLRTSPSLFVHIKKENAPKLYGLGKETITYLNKILEEQGYKWK